MITTTITSPSQIIGQRQSTSLVTVNVAFLQEIKEASQDLWRTVGKLHALCSRPIELRMHMRNAVELLRELLDELGLYFSLEEYYGYFEDPAYVDPRLSERANMMRAEHQELFLDLCGIVDRAERLLYQRRFATLMRHFVLRFGAFSEQLKAHEAHENEMLLEALDDDIGVGD